VSIFNIWLMCVSNAHMYHIIPYMYLLEPYNPEQSIPWVQVHTQVAQTKNWQYFSHHPHGMTMANMPNSQERKYLYAIQAMLYNPYGISRNLPHLLVWENRFSCCHSEFHHRNSVNRCFYTCTRYDFYHNIIVYPWL
jgi:hypothetical protein